MRIGFDAKRAICNLTGLGNYSRGLIRSLVAAYPENEYFLYTPSAKENSRLNFLNDTNARIMLPRSWWGRRLSSFWRTFGLTRQLQQDNIDLFHGLSHELPYRIDKVGIKSVVTIHDLIFLRYPRLYTFADRRVYLKKIRHSCRIADSIVAVSKQTRRDLIDFLSIKPERIQVIYQSCDPIFYHSASTEQKAACRKRYHLPTQYILSVGTIEERKNLLLLIKAIELLKSKLDLFLIVIGRATAYKDQVTAHIQKAGLADRVLFLEDVSFPDFPAIYQMASSFVYPSRFEGFGIPIVEALFSKVPVIATRGSCLEESGGPESVYVSPDSADELAQKLELTLTDSILRTKITATGYSYAQRFREEIVAGNVMAHYVELIGS
ncbi:MAG: glycosyltransferase family 4 protein [candidate division Zixibacteria bacterium]|nr:glycosyltransferase family 4 protein [candidate division Zixibacteria bacterium]